MRTSAGAWRLTPESASGSSAARLVTRAYRTSSSQRTSTLRITVSRKLRSRLRAARTRRLRVRVTPTTPAGTAANVTLAVAKPR